MLGLGLIAVVTATVLVVVLPSPAIPVAVTGLAATGIRLGTGRDHLPHVAGELSVPTLAGLFGVAVALGTLGRAWAGPATLASHLGLWGTGRARSHRLSVGPHRALSRAAPRWRH